MKIIYENDKGGVSVVTPSPESLRAKGSKKVPGKFTIEEIAAKDVPNGVAFEIVEDSVVPSDRTFRGAWRKGSGKVDVDMPSARVIHMGRIRKARDERLKVLDQRRFGSEYDAEREALRNLPDTFDLEVATTPEELANLTPVELAG